MIRLELEGVVTGDKVVIGNYRIFPALDSQQLDALIRILQDRLPEQTDFESPGSKKAVSKSGMFDVAAIDFGLGRTFTPPSKQEIEQYAEKRYPDWLASCRKVFRSLHMRLQLQQSVPCVSVLLGNVGSRPAENALVSFYARGSFRIQPPPEDDEPAPAEAALEEPPPAPKGRWTSAFDSIITGGGFASPLRLSRFDGAPLGAMRHLRDDEAFYWRPSRPTLPVQEFSLECALWRHQIAAKRFEARLHFFSLQDAEVKGAVEVQVHAANLTDAFSQHVPIRVSIQRGDTYAEAARLIDQLADASK